VPTYQYACTGCHHELEAVQSFSDDPLTTCPECGGSLRKLFGNVGVVFKGSGFYRNDARKAAASSSDASTTGSTTKTETPAASTPSSSTPASSAPSGASSAS
jgi:putative FmdB family regulatory protein